jgi:hypothetical protein
LAPGVRALPSSSDSVIDMGLMAADGSNMQDEIKDGDHLRSATRLSGRQIAGRLWLTRWWGLALVCAFLAAAMLYLNMATYRYDITFSVTPVEQPSGGNIPGGLASLGSLVGFNIGGSSGSAFGLYPNAIRSQNVAERLSRDEQLMRAVFEDEWDSASNRWRQPQSVLGGLIRAVRSLTGMPARRWHPPGATELQRYIVDNVAIIDDRKEATVHLVMQQAKPAFATRFLSALHGASDNFLRQRYHARSTAYIRYLERRLASVQVTEYRQTLAEALASFERTRMMASVDSAFAAEPFGDPVVSLEPTSPRPLVVVAIAVALGLLGWGAMAILDLGSGAGRRAATTAAETALA